MPIEMGKLVLDDDRAEAALPEALLRSEAYPHAAQRPRLITTHISWILLAGRFAYKLKRPVDLGFVDYTTRDRREHFCQEELLLNRRLTRDVYLDVVPIVQTPAGIRVSGDGAVIDHAVRMRRLPQQRMLNRLLARGDIDGEQAAEIGSLIARFHATATRAAPGDPGGAATVQENIAENFRQTRPFVSRTITPEQFAAITSYSEHFVKQNETLLDVRQTAGWVRDVHGDLRADNICLSQGIQVFDCIEFSRRLRIEDVAAEVAFLAMDFDFWGYPELARVFVAAYASSSPDPQLRDLLPFYQCYRAYVRGKVESLRLDQPDLAQVDARSAIRRARRYFALADKYARRRPVLLLVTGLSGTGKSRLATRLADLLAWPVLNSDRVRKELAGLAAESRVPAADEAGIYDQAFTERTYAALLDGADHLLSAGNSIVLDATFLLRDQRDAAQALAARHRAALRMIVCTAPEAVVATRLAERATEPTAVSDAGWDVYMAQRRHQEPVQRAEGTVLRLSTTQRPETLARRALRWLSEPARFD
ncbi:MAG TPA: AAA family ATPase [Dehalococcoidia bacterium]